MGFPANKTKIVCTVGPASDSMEVLQRMILAGMNVARLNFSHGDFAGHAEKVDRIRQAAKNVGQRVAIMADLPGPKLRIGQLKNEPITLETGQPFTLSTEEMAGDATRVSVCFDRLPLVVKPRDLLYLNDGFIQLKVEAVEGSEVHTQVVVGHELRSRKGLNLPGLELGINAFTEHDHNCLKFAAEHNLDAVSQSFVESGTDIQAVREAAEQMGYEPFVIAKIERSRALENIDGILDASDGIMIARGDLGVEIPIERIAVAQKQLMRKANILGKPVITATQMLESMTSNRLPTRAESTDVANAILDGTDCVMLSDESALGHYPVDAVKMLAGIAATVEPYQSSTPIYKALKSHGRDGNIALSDLIALSVENTLQRITPAAVIVPTKGGATARSIARFRLPVWITAVSSQEKTCQRLLFSYGVFPYYEPDHPDDWRQFSGTWLRAQGVDGHLVVLTEGPSTKHPDRNNRMEIIDLERRV